VIDAPVNQCIADGRSLCHPDEFVGNRH
jgi:hypothetical protein